MTQAKAKVALVSSKNPYSSWIPGVLTRASRFEHFTWTDSSEPSRGEGVTMTSLTTGGAEAKGVEEVVQNKSFLELGSNPEPDSRVRS